MPHIHAPAIIARGWVAHYSGFPADLFFSGNANASPWEIVPHLHLNYAMDGSLQSLTYKNEASKNTYLYSRGAWLPNPFGITSAAILAEIAHLRTLP